MKLLISALGGTFFPYLHSKLKDDFDVCYVDSSNQLDIVYKDYNFFKIPLAREPEYLTFLKNIVQKEKVHFFVPLIDEELLISKKHLEGFEGMHVISPSVNFTEICLNKFSLMNFLKKNNISNVESYIGDLFKWEIPFPIFVKPISGRGSRGIKKIESKKQLDSYYILEKYQRKDTIIQPFLEGTEYTIGVLASKNNDLISISSKRVIQKKGITQMAVTENNPLIDNVVYKIIDIMKPSGPFNIQLILTQKNEIKIFEINPRFSTTSIMEFEGGVNLISLYIEYLNKKFSQEIIRPKVGLHLYRRWESLFYEKQD